jgi:hypothetical protein
VSSTVGSLDEDRLEAAGQRGVLFDMLAVFVERGRADAVQFAAGKGRLQQVGRVHGAVRLAGADQRMHLVDEQDDRAGGGLDLVENGLQALLELAAIFRAGDQRAHVERHQLLVLQALRHVAIDDAQGEAFGDGGLADAGFADQDGLFLVRRDRTWMVRRISSSRPITGSSLPSRIGGQVAGVFLQRVIGLFGAGAVGGAALADIVDRLVEPGRRDAGLGEDVGRLRRFFHRQREQQALDGDIGVAGLGGDFLRRVHDLGERLGHVELAVAALHLGLGVERGLDAETDFARLAAGALDQRRGKAFRIVDQDFQNVFGRELLVILPESESLGRLNETTDAVGIFLKIHFGLQSPGQPVKALAGSSMTGSRLAANPCSNWIW